MSTSAGVSRPNMFTLSFTLKVSVLISVYNAHKAFQRTGRDLDAVPCGEIHRQRGFGLHAHFFHFLGGQGDRLGSGPDETGAARVLRTTYQVSSFITILTST